MTGEGILDMTFPNEKRAIGRHWPATAGKEKDMDLRKMMAERLKQYQLLIAFAAKQKQAEKQES